MTKNRILVTGATGFIGAAVTKHIAQHTDWEVVALSRESVSGTRHRLVDDPSWPQIRSRVSFVHHDLRSPISAMTAHRIGPVNYVAHLGASTHVDRSITDPMSFVLDNVVGTCNILDYARTQTDLKRFLYFSTDEVFGPAPEGTNYLEDARYNSGNPYAAAKAGGEELAVAYGNTFGLPVIVTHTMNVIGPYQHPEKFLPNTIRKVLNGETVTIHANKDRTKSGSRFYIHADEVGRAVLFLLHFGNVQEKYNIVGYEETSNLDLAQLIAKVMQKPLNYEMVDFHSSRPGHDLRYALDGTKLHQMGFRFHRTYHDTVEETVLWYLQHQEWLGQ